MNLQPREKRLIVTLLPIAIVVAGYTWVVKPIAKRVGSKNPTTDRMRGQFATQRSRILRYSSVARQLEALTKELNVEIAGGTPSDQMKNVVQQLESLAARSQVPINNIQELKSRARSSPASGNQGVELRLQLTGKSFVSVMKFLDSLEQAKFPVAFEQISINSSGAVSSGGASGRGGTPGRGGQPSRGGSKGRQLQCGLKIRTYLFPEKVSQ